MTLYQVSKPLDVKTKFLSVEEDVLLEVQIQNTTTQPMFLERVNFDPNSGFLAQDLNLLRLKQRPEEGNREGEGEKADKEGSVGGNDSIR